ncbi:MAG TPA: CRTAC1 family protein [Bryobacteraceae bacterium]|nr:CRTAC1 family protein [Bryobacteraceae bacterium]
MLWLIVMALALSGASTEHAPLPVFVDTAAKAGVTFRLLSSRTPQKYLIETMPGGVAMLDYDGDGRQDLFFVNGAALRNPMPAGVLPDKSDPKYWNRLYHNNGDGTFTDVTEKAGVRGHSYGMGVAVGDYDNDGYPDLYVTNFGHNILYHNNGNGTFTDVTDMAGVAAGGWSSSALFIDYDRDGYLDLFVARYLDWDFSKNLPCGAPEKGEPAYCHPDVFKSATYFLYHNNHDGTFTDVTAKSGIGAAPGRGLGSALNDYDQDGWPDILVANDAIAEQLFHNNHNGTFTEVGIPAGLAYDEDGVAFSGMGVAFEDYDNDGWPDIFIGDLANQKYALFHNLKGTFQYVSGMTGVARMTMPHSGWGTGLIDYDNDGWKDLFVAQSHVMDNIQYFQGNVRYLESLLLLRNVAGHFEDVSAQSGAPFKTVQAARGAAFGDLDNDGQIDVVVSCLDGQPMVLHNQGSANHWLTVNTIGTVSNRDGIGARLHLVSSSGANQYATVSTGGSYFSANDKRVHFGLGQEHSVRMLEITWPSGIVQKLENPAVDRILTVREPAKGDRKQ